MQGATHRKAWSEYKKRVKWKTSLWIQRYHWMREKIARDEKWEQTHVESYYDRENLVDPYHAGVIVDDDSFSPSVLFVMTLETSVQSAKCRKHIFLWSPKCRKDNQAEARILQVSKARGLCRRK